MSQELVSNLLWAYSLSSRRNKPKLNLMTTPIVKSLYLAVFEMVPCYRLVIRQNGLTLTLDAFPRSQERFLTKDGSPMRTTAATGKSNVSFQSTHPVFSGGQLTVLGHDRRVWRSWFKSCRAAAAQEIGSHLSSLKVSVPLLQAELSRVLIGGLAHLRVTKKHHLAVRATGLIVQHNLGQVADTGSLRRHIWIQQGGIWIGGNI